jgi:hypothetical protein
MRSALIVMFALLVIPHPAFSKKREYHWKTGKLTVLTSETNHPKDALQPDLSSVPAAQAVEETWTYQVDGEEGVYVVKISPEPLTTVSGVTIQYDIEGKIMHVDATLNGKKLKIKDLQILKFTPTK